MLDRGAEIVREHLHDQPLVRARLLDAMGNSYRSLGAWDSARERITEALDIRRRFLGDNHPDTIVSLQSLAHLTRERGDYNEADRLYREVIARREQIHTTDHLLTAETKFYLAWMTMHRPLSNDGPQFDTALVAESERLLLEVLKVREAQLPANHRDIGYTLAALAGAKLCQPNQEIYALGYATRAADVFRKSEQNTQFGSAMLEILESNRHRNARRFDQAEAGYLKVLNLTRKHLGNRHPLILLQLGNLAGMYRSMGDFPKAEQMVKEALEGARTLPLLRTQPICVDFMLQYGDEIRNRRSPAEARAVYGEALRYARERPQGNEKNIAALEQRLAELPP
jgi:tetratricopeptide (TPR) repeat protein